MDGKKPAGKAKQQGSPAVSGTKRGRATSPDLPAPKRGAQTSGPPPHFRAETGGGGGAYVERARAAQEQGAGASSSSSSLASGRSQRQPKEEQRDKAPPKQQVPIPINSDDEDDLIDDTPMAMARRTIEARKRGALLPAPAPATKATESPRKATGGFRPSPSTFSDWASAARGVSSPVSIGSPSVQEVQTPNRPSPSTRHSPPDTIRFRQSPASSDESSELIWNTG